MLCCTLFKTDKDLTQLDTAYDALWWQEGLYAGMNYLTIVLDRPTGGGRLFDGDLGYVDLLGLSHLGDLKQARP